MKTPLLPLALALSVLTGCSASSSPSEKTAGAGDSGASDVASSKPPGTDAAKDGNGQPVEAGHIDDASHDAPSTAPTAPPQAAAAGYDVETFSSTFAKADIDLTNSEKSGYQWYLGQFFGGAATSPSDLTWNADGTLDLNGAGTSSNAGINTASPSSGSAGWVGLAFGGGAYFEATFKFDPANTIEAGGKGWPSWWAMAIEHLAGLPSEQWPGQATGYDHFIETDFFEYDVWSFSPHYEYGGAMHDWYGIYEKTCSGNYCNVSNAGGGGTLFSNFQVETPSTTIFTDDHAFGFLWLPATSTTPGKATYYFDGKATNDVVTWSLYAGTDSPPPGTAPWTFGVVDGQHLVLILGTGSGEPMTLRSVSVWQKSAADNLVE
jgi:hypothetical protein